MLVSNFRGKCQKDLPLETDGLYTINSNRSDGYNLNYLTWNASAGKKFLKNENLIVSLIAKDILNQNISAGRSVSSNVITDSKTTIIKRYFLLQLTYKFNSTKTKEEDNDWGM
ncbi:MAG: outer membrane beta-barrel protein [Bacteroidetes bacterium]|nr:outer membrane beta-barrel protein [Bacteroidota bacterium]